MRASRVKQDGISGSARLAAGVTIAAGSLLLVACGPGQGAGDAGANRPGVKRMSVSLSVSTPRAMPAPSAHPFIPAQPSPSSAGPQPNASAAGTSCAQFAANTFLHLTSVTNEPDGSLALTANPVTVVCGGPDDLSYEVGTGTVTARVTPNASVTIFNLAGMQPTAIGANQLTGYLPTDRGTRIFLVSGPLRAVTSMQEEYHP